MTKKTDQKPEQVEKEETRFTKTALLKSKRFTLHQDILMAFLNADQEYTIAEAETLIANWLTKGTVN